MEPDERINVFVCVCPNGTRRWGYHGGFHRDDGPAIIFSNGTRQWWLYNIQYTKLEWAQRVKNPLVGFWNDYNDR